MPSSTFTSSSTPSTGVLSAMRRTHLDHGAHFTAWQVPGTIADEIAAFAADLLANSARPRVGPTGDEATSMLDGD
ncbi:hypothetical protein [Curtobacterium sp. MCJR17_020]|uniref:hypothetical protein n=2 Tax=unclassified Curtobacterium TaxID=257496 RepID=UPI0011B76B19|nr:hypothetical protein [Curtobacterium sp. MCJR17_020]QSB22316.1 hypothetical protein JN350_12075 [Curtobacterium sp. 24E2]WIE73897.1 hypothetical protein DEJ14_009010 [Curtobacterium sp. MCJR17_020]